MFPRFRATRTFCNEPLSIEERILATNQQTKKDYEAVSYVIPRPFTSIWGGSKYQEKALGRRWQAPSPSIHLLFYGN